MPRGKKKASHFQGEVIRKQKIWVNGGHQWVKRRELNRFKKRSRDAVRNRSCVVRRWGGYQDSEVAVDSDEGCFWITQSYFYIIHTYFLQFRVFGWDHCSFQPSKLDYISGLQDGTWHMGKQNCSETNTDVACKVTGKTFPRPQPLARIPITENSVDSRICSRPSI